MRRTARPLTRAQLTRLAADAFPDFELQPRDATDRMIEFRHVTRARPKLAVTVQLATCRPRACPSMDVARWRARRTELLRELPASLRANRGTRFEIGAQKIAGAPAVTVYELGYASTDDHGQPAADYIDAYVVYYNDGVNQMRIMAHYVDDALGSAEHLLAIAPPEDLQKLAVSFASYYMHAW